MPKIRLTKVFTFEAAHALHGYDGKCKNVHGHSYKLWVTVIGKPIDDKSNTKYGMVIDFGDIKTIVKKYIIDRFDHVTVLNRNSPHMHLGEVMMSEMQNVIFVDYQPTSENMLLDFSCIIAEQLPKNVQLHSLRLQETETSMAEWFADDNP